MLSKCRRILASIFAAHPYLGEGLLTAWFLQGCTANGQPGFAGEVPLPALVPRRVTSTVRREALGLVRLETEHESFFTTPEHPFATPRAGWVSAGRLGPGDWLVSERLGAVRLRSARTQPTHRPVPVFNLSVASSHAYFIGTDRLLVHNTACKKPSFESRQAALEHALREREEANRQITALRQIAPASPEIAELKARRQMLQRRIDNLRGTLRRAQTAEAPKSERPRNVYQDDHESTRNALQGAQRELAELQQREPSSEAERDHFAARKAALEKQITALTLSYDRTTQILSLMRDLAELEKETPTLDAERRALRERRKALRAQLDKERARARLLKHVRKMRAQPERREREASYQRDLLHRLRRTPRHLADTQRPRDPIELLENELAGRLQEPPSESRDARLHHLADRIETMKEMVSVRKQIHRLIVKRGRLGTSRKERLSEDRSVQRTTEELQAYRIELTKLRVRERLLAQLDGTPWGQAPEWVDEVQLHDLERRLALVAEQSESEQQLAEPEQTLATMDPADADWQHALNEADAADAPLSERAERMPQEPSPERAAAREPDYERLQRELREGRAALEAALAALANELAYTQTTQAGSSSGPTWQDRVRAIQEEQRTLLAHWHASLQARLDSAQVQLRLLTNIERFRDEAVEAELTREIALLQRELQGPGG